MITYRSTSDVWSSGGDPGVSQALNWPFLSAACREAYAAAPDPPQITLPPASAAIQAILTAEHIAKLDRQLGDSTAPSCDTSSNISAGSHISELLFSSPQPAGQQQVASHAVPAASREPARAQRGRRSPAKGPSKGGGQRTAPAARRPRAATPSEEPVAARGLDALAACAALLCGEVELPRTAQLSGAQQGGDQVCCLLQFVSHCFGGLRDSQINADSRHMAIAPICCLFNMACVVSSTPCVSLRLTGLDVGAAAGPSHERAARPSQHARRQGGAAVPGGYPAGSFAAARMGHGACGGAGGGDCTAHRAAPVAVTACCRRRDGARRGVCDRRAAALGSGGLARPVAYSPACGAPGPAAPPDGDAVRHESAAGGGEGAGLGRRCSVRGHRLAVAGREDQGTERGALCF